MPISAPLLRPLLFALAMLATQSAFAIVTVGPKTDAQGCTFQSIQQAINSVLSHERNNSPDTDPYIAIAGGRVYNEKLVVDGSGVNAYQNPLGQTGAYVAIFGNFDDHCDAPTNTPALISAGGSQAGNSVVRISGFTALSLNNLILANAVVGGNGGGINFESSGSLDLTNVEITNNQAGFGGGIFANGHPVGISVTLHGGTWIHGNTAAHAGGGIRIQGETRLFALEPQTLLEYNLVSSSDSLGRGGGLSVTGAQAIADIGSPGFNGTPTVSNNSASYGGGIAIADGGSVRLFSSVESQPARIEYNSAVNYGGGVYLDGSNSAARLCGSGYSISHNSANEGAAIYSFDGPVDFTASGLQCNIEPFLPDHAACTPGASPCNTIDANVSAQVGRVTAAIVLIGADMTANAISLRGNAAGAVIDTDANSLTLVNCLLADNPVFSSTILVDNANLDMSSCTLAGNAGSSVIEYLAPGAPTSVSVQRSIIWQPGASTLKTFNSRATIQFIDLLTSDAAAIDPAGFGAFANVNAADPRFVDPANGNYRLQPESPAVDYAPIGAAVDLEGRPRPIDLLHFNASFTPYDIGAYEVQDLGDVIFASGYDRARNN